MIPLDIQLPSGRAQGVLTNLVQATDGQLLPLDSLTVTPTFVASGTYQGNLETLTVTHNGNTYVQTFTWAGSFPSISRWVKQ